MVELDRIVPLTPLLASAIALVTFLVAIFGRGPARRIDERRSILVHADTDGAWSSLRRVPDLIGRHGKTSDYADLTAWTLRHGDGDSPGSVWRADGTWGPRPYWFEVEIVRSDAGRELTIRLRRDAFGTERGVRGHRGTLQLNPAGSGTTKITWHLSARLTGARLLPARFMSPATLRARLLDQKLRSLKAEIDFVARDRNRPDVSAAVPLAAPEARPADAPLPIPPRGADPSSPERTT